MDREGEMAMVRRHVHEGEACVERQARLVATLKGCGHAEAAGLGEELLMVMIETLTLHQQHLAKLQAGITEPRWWIPASQS
jgi:hypothetical protein